MYTKKLKRIIRLLESKKHVFSQNIIVSRNGSCVAGHTLILLHGFEKAVVLADTDSGKAFEEVRKYLGLTDHQAKDIFFTFTSPDGDDVRRKDAIRMLKRLRKTGEVVWKF